MEDYKKCKYCGSLNMSYSHYFNDAKCNDCYRFQISGDVLKPLHESRKEALLKWEKINDKTYQAFKDGWHLFTFVGDGFGGGKLLIQFYGDTVEKTSKLNCPGGIFQAKREAENRLKKFINDLIQ